MSTDAPAENVDRERLPGTSAGDILRESVARIAADPVLALPFVVAGLLLAAVDWLRLRDPVPTTTPPRMGDVTVHVAYQFYPAGVRGTGVRPAALVDLELPYLAWTVGAELAAFLAVALAGWVVLSRAADAERTPGSLARYLAFAVGAHVLLGLFALFDGLGWLALLALAAYLSAAVRLFAAPALVVAGRDLRTAIGESARRSRGEGATVVALVVLVGLAAWLLGSVPVVGAFLSTAVVAPVHAVAAVAFVESAEA
ncbi:MULTISPECIES: hypothetical protein [Halorussus]|uniref:hypothetical protein n=1 Tax=Halorussus TaxID=1070314 RepID=UPI000E211A38|nr:MULTISPECIES: hypothetical protein [Halorussus]NHN58410.1 hypothetical protein [Halorussus sp. JP-T4]